YNSYIMEEKNEFERDTREREEEMYSFHLDSTKTFVLKKTGMMVADEEDLSFS
ncbi:hypothetical protein CSUI_008648, partial [Cystoisospora suis]